VIAELIEWIDIEAGRVRLTASLGLPVLPRDSIKQLEGLSRKYKNSDGPPDFFDPKKRLDASFHAK
jgi:hypothetical protein